MNLKDLISDALSLPSDLIAYEVSRRLAELRPDQTVIEGSSIRFDLTAHANAGRCSIVGEGSVFNKSRVEATASGNDFVDEPENAWFNVLWEGNLLDVLLLTWTQEGYKDRHYWIIAETRRIADDFLRAVTKWDSEVRGEILVFDGGYWYRDRELFETIKATNFDNIILPTELKCEIREDFARFFASRDLYERYHIPWKRGVLLIGPPGNGKTHTVKALINETKQACLYVKSFKGCWGTDHDRIRAVFRQARKTTPSIVVLEDLDTLVDEQNRSFFLNELDGFAQNTGVVVLATTNHPEKLDPAILDRPSRFDRKYLFQLPSLEGRAAYLQKWRESVEAELRFPHESLNHIAALTKGFSFAYLKELCLSAMMAWMEDRSIPMEQVISRTAQLLRKEINQNRDSKKKETQKKKSKSAAVGCGHWS